MLTHERLVELYRQLREENVLSVYLDVDQHDPAERTKWRRRLEQEVARRRKQLNGNSERQEFEEAWSRIREELEGFDAFVPQKGWVGFATPGQLWYAEDLPVRMPDGVYWEKGMRVAPYVRGLKQERPVVVALMDSQRGRLFRYREGELSEVEDVRADTFVGDLSDVGMSKQGTTRTGIRGETSADHAQRILGVSADRMLKHLMDRVGEAAGPHGFVVIGATTEVAARAHAMLPKALQSRALEAPPLHIEMKDSEVREAAEHYASLLTERHQEELLTQVVDAARSGGRACLGREETERALQEMRVDTLLLSRSFIRDHADAADRCVGAALAQDAAVEEHSQLAADRLDREGEGVAARLRFTIRQNGDRPGSHTPGDETPHHP